MPTLSANVIVTQGQVRHFLQWGGPIPGNPANYAGKDAQYMELTGVTIPVGDITPIWRPDPRTRKRYVMVARSVAAPDIPTATLMMSESHGALPRQLQKIVCPFNLYDMVGSCVDPSDFLSGWNDYVMIYGEAEVTNKNLGDRSAYDSDEALGDGLDISFARIYPIGSLSFGDNAASLITLEVIDVVYGSKENCADCGPADDGTNWIYAITKSSGSTPGTAPRLVYTVTGGQAWIQAAVDGLGDTEDPSGIDLVGNYLVVYTRTAGGPTTSGYYYAEINAYTGVPGTWTKVTSGFQAAIGVYDMYVLDSREVYFAADGGVVYKATDITSGVTAIQTPTTTALRRINGDGDNTIVAVGGSGTLVVSRNRGYSWFAPTGTGLPVALLQALTVVSDNVWWVGTSAGTLYSTKNGGETWVQKGFSGSGAGQIYDLVAVTPEVLFMAHSNATPTARLFTTWDGGEDWTMSRPRLQNLPTANRFNRLAYPNVDPSIAANNLAVAGLAGNGSDGILLLGLASRL